MPAVPLDPESLSLSRVNRLLRPLRSKCAHLAAAAKSPSCTQPERAIYGRRHAFVGSDALNAPPPLAVIPNPRQICGRAHLDRRSMRNLKPSQAIYGVVDAWGNVLQACVPLDEKSVAGDGPAAGIGIQPLVAMCAAIVGEAVEDEVKARLADGDEEEEEQVPDADEGMGILHEYYDAIPARYRSWTLVAHSLSIIRETCPHNPTLLSALLDLALGRRLVQESLHILHWLLVFAVRPSRSTGHSHIEHPDHYSFLKDLCTRWVSACSASPTPPLPTALPDPSTSSTTPPTHPDPNSSPFTHHGFTSELVAVLHEYASPKAWTSPSTICFARYLRQADGAAYAELCAGLAEIAASQSDAEMAKKLAWWIDSVPDAHLADPRSHAAVVDVLVCARELGLHSHARSTVPFRALEDLRRALFSAAVRVVHAEAFAGAEETRAREHRDVLALLSADRSEGGTPARPFDAVFATVFPPADIIRTSTPLPSILLSLQNVAATLSAHGFLRLKKVLWICASQYASKWHPTEKMYDLEALDAFRRDVEREREKAVEEYTEAMGGDDEMEDEDEDEVYDAGPRPRGAQGKSDDEAFARLARKRIDKVRKRAGAEGAAARRQRQQQERKASLDSDSSDADSDGDGEYRPALGRGGGRASKTRTQTRRRLPRAATRVSQAQTQPTTNGKPSSSSSSRRTQASVASAPPTPTGRRRARAPVSNSSSSSRTPSTLFSPPSSPSSSNSESDSSASPDEEASDWAHEDSASDWELERKVYRRRKPALAVNGTPGRRLNLPMTGGRKPTKRVVSSEEDEESEGSVEQQDESVQSSCESERSAPARRPVARSTRQRVVPGKALPARRRTDITDDGAASSSSEDEEPRKSYARPRYTGPSPRPSMVYVMLPSRPRLSLPPPTRTVAAGTPNRRKAPRTPQRVLRQSARLVSRRASTATSSDSQSSDESGGEEEEEERSRPPLRRCLSLATLKTKLVHPTRTRARARSPSSSTTSPSPKRARMSLRSGGGGGDIRQWPPTPKSSVAILAEAKRRASLPNTKRAPLLSVQRTPKAVRTRRVTRQSRRLGYRDGSSEDQMDLFKYE